MDKKDSTITMAMIMAISLIPFLPLNFFILLHFTF